MNSNNINIEASNPAEAINPFEAIKTKIINAGYNKVPHINDDFTWNLLFDNKVLTGPEIGKIRTAILSSTSVQGK